MADRSVILVDPATGRQLAQMPAWVAHKLLHPLGPDCPRCGFDHPDGEA